MFEQDTIQHHIQRSIIGVLMKQEFARFRDLKPEKIDTNLFSYHLKLLQKSGFIAKVDQGYTLAEKGLQYVDRVNTDHMKLRSQPKIITMLLVQDSYGRVLLQKRQKQPYINTWTLPYGKLHIDDESVIAAARREAWEKLGVEAPVLRHVGDCYITVGRTAKIAVAPIAAGALVDGDTLHLNTKDIWQIESRTLAHIVRFESDTIAMIKDLKWVDPLELPTLTLAPAVEAIIARSFFGDTFFFEEFRVDKS